MRVWLWKCRPGFGGCYWRGLGGRNAVFSTFKEAEAYARSEQDWAWSEHGECVRAQIADATGLVVAELL